MTSNSENLAQSGSSTLSVELFHQFQSRGICNTQQALEIFDGLECAETDFMLGAWRGTGFPTHQPLDGVLEVFHWHGKRFESLDDVHPLVFKKSNGNKASVNPAWVMPVASVLTSAAVPKWAWLGNLFRHLLPLFATRKGRARLRMTQYRGKLSATMVYDNLPIHDVFRKVDEDTVLGIMDLKGLNAPFFFVLHRESV